MTAEPDKTTEALVTLLYILLRDEITAGVLHRVMRDHAVIVGPGAKAHTFSCRHTEALARDVAGRILKSG